jgi:hypothetical protein
MKGENLPDISMVCPLAVEAPKVHTGMWQKQPYESGLESHFRRIASSQHLTYLLLLVNLDGGANTEARTISELLDRGSEGSTAQEGNEFEVHRAGQDKQKQKQSVFNV